MRIHYDRETDSLYIELADTPGADAREAADGVALDVDAAGAIVGVDIQHASERIDLTTLETRGLPLADVSLAQG